jgi:GT2 family glycosyltransferase
MSPGTEVHPVGPRASIVIGSRNRPAIVLSAIQSVLTQSVTNIEVLVLDDASADIDAYSSAIAQLRDSRIRLLRSEHPLGVAGGRNLLERTACGSVVVVLDDDAVFDSNETVSGILSALERYRGVGILATKVRDFRSGKERLLIPFPRAALRSHPALADSEWDVSYYLGTCHATTRACLDACGGYREDMVYGSEELDRSFRAIQLGYRIRYVPTVTVSHHPAPSVVPRGGLRNGEVYHDLCNRLYLAHRYLPGAYAASYSAIWTLRTLGAAAVAGHLGEWFQALHDCRAQSAQTLREPLNAKQVAYVKHHWGRLWY